MTKNTVLKTPPWSGRKFSFAALMACCLVLGGCIEAALIGGAATSVMVGSDRRPPEVVLGDERVEFTAINRLSRGLNEKSHVNITSYNYTVLLTGEVTDAKAKEEAEKIVAQIERVKGVVNEIQVGAASSMQSRANDTFLTGRIKAAFVTPQKFSPFSVKVVTEAGVVFLLGLVTRTEADDATEIARGIGGVQKVVRVFEYIPVAPPAPSSGTK
ncbi:MAG: BON domain-containing protein [Burkholderiales bacterium]